MKAYCNLTIRRLQMEALIALAAAAALQLHGQGTVSFSNLGVANSFVYDGRFGPVVKATVGTTFSVALYWAPVDPLNPTVQPVSSAFTQQGPTGHIAPLPGDYAAGIVTILGISPPGGMAWFRVKAWETACGLTYEEAYNHPGNSVFGQSSVINIRTGDPNTGGNPALLTGIGSIYLGPIGAPYGDPCVPEPSTALLVFPGALLLVCLSRGKRTWRRGEGC